MTKLKLGIKYSLGEISKKNWRGEPWATLLPEFFLRREERRERKKLETEKRCESHYYAKIGVIGHHEIGWQSINNESMPWGSLTLVQIYWRGKIIQLSRATKRFSHYFFFSLFSPRRFALRLLPLNGSSLRKPLALTVGMSRIKVSVYSTPPSPPPPWRLNWGPQRRSNAHASLNAHASSLV